MRMAHGSLQRMLVLIDFGSGAGDVYDSGAGMLRLPLRAGLHLFPGALCT